MNAGGSCGAQSEWKMKLKPDNSRLELEFEVDSNVSGQSWNVQIRQNGSRIFTGTRVTQGASGSFTVHRRPNDSTGIDKFVARATNPSTGETCVGRARISIFANQPAERVGPLKLGADAPSFSTCPSSRRRRLV